ncbi:cell surface glycoprotein MUC18 [Heptranchias perlo]|uniref:cell surface glycoprotein MUC18 n=1 Tax=Heptranchias perlo TaxID=212740 RepID=UPI00355A4ED1
MKWFLSALLLACLCFQTVLNTKLQVVIKEPRGPIVEGSDVILQCVGDGADMSQYKFQMYHKWLKTWFSFDTKTPFRCWYYSFNVTRENGELFLQVKEMYKWHAGPYRCISNGTDGQLPSENITVPLQYLNGISISEPGSLFSRYMRDPRVVRVMRGKDVEIKCSAFSSEPPEYQWKREGDDWIYPSNNLKIVKITPEEAGTYTCKASHPSIPSLTQSKSVLIKVVDEPLTSLQLSEMNLILAIAIPAGILFLTVVTVITYMCKAKRNQMKGLQLQNENALKTPIWKGSDSSLPYTVSDTIPLVM